MLICNLTDNQFFENNLTRGARLLVISAGWISSGKNLFVVRKTESIFPKGKNVDYNIGFN
jgi:hypothetical protein